jgi:hypothetical protein
MTSGSARWVCIGLLVLGGCGGQTGQPVDTGARAAALGFAEAIAGQEWSRAYDHLHAESRTQLKHDDFDQQASQYRRAFGFEPTRVRVRACEEQGEEAKAHVVFSGQAKSGSRQFRDTFLLRRGPEGWGVVLPRHFGRTTRR